MLPQRELLLGELLSSLAKYLHDQREAHGEPSQELLGLTAKLAAFTECVQHDYGANCVGTPPPSGLLALTDLGMIPMGSPSQKQRQDTAVLKHMLSAGGPTGTALATAACDLTSIGHQSIVPSSEWSVTACRSSCHSAALPSPAPAESVLADQWAPPRTQAHGP